MLKRVLLIFSSLSYGVLPGKSLEYEAELVYPQLLSARDEQGTTVLRISEKISLNLKKSSVLHDEFFLLTHRDGVPLRTYPDVDELEEDLFHDEKQLASVFVSQDSGFVKVEGAVGPNLKIRPLEGTERTNEGFFPHALELISNEPEKVPPVHGEHIPSRSAKMEGRSTNVRHRKVKSVHPEIRLVVDEAFHSGFKHTRNMVRYILVEMNSVRVRYLTVGDPEVHLKLRAIEILAEEIECEYYIFLNDKQVDGIATIYSLVEYVDRYRIKYEKYDIVMVVTGYDMVRFSQGKVEASYRGFAFVASVCEKHRVGFSEDYAYTYAGIRVIAHELAHTLGCSHDGDEEGTYLRGYYANSTGCPWSDGFIMSYIVKDANSLKFSKCCDLSMSLVSWSYNIECLHKMTSGTRLKRYRSKTLPGYFLSTDKQCKLSYLADPETYYNRANGTHGCVAQCGVTWRNAPYFWNQVLLDGTKCERKKKMKNKKICINGKCVWKKGRYPITRVGE